MRSSNRHVLVVIFFIFLLGNLCSPREIFMRSKRNVQSQEQTTRTSIDSFLNEVFNGTTPTDWQRSDRGYGV